MSPSGLCAAALEAVDQGLGAIADHFTGALRSPEGRLYAVVVGLLALSALGWLSRRAWRRWRARSEPPARGLAVLTEGPGSLGALLAFGCLVGLGIWFGVRCVSPLAGIDPDRVALQLQAVEIELDVARRSLVEAVSHSASQTATTHQGPLQDAIGTLTRWRWRLLGLVAALATGGLAWWALLRWARGLAGFERALLVLLPLGCAAGLVIYGALILSRFS